MKSYRLLKNSQFNGIIWRASTITYPSVSSFFKDTLYALFRTNSNEPRECHILSIFSFLVYQDRGTFFIIYYVFNFTSSITDGIRNSQFMRPLFSKKGMKPLSSPYPRYHRENRNFQQMAGSILSPVL